MTTPHDKALEAAAKALASRLDKSLGFPDGTAWSIPDANGNPGSTGQIEDTAAAISAYLSSIGGVVISAEPTDDLLRSMAIRYDHGLGVPGYYDQPVFGAENGGHARRMEATITTMRQLHEEVVGKGFYEPPLHAPIPEAGNGVGWMPIETAPKDGTEILGFGAASYRGKRYAPGRHIAWFDLGKWWGRDPDTEAGLDLMMWRPLPSPPSILKEGAER